MYNFVSVVVLFGGGRNKVVHQNANNYGMVSVYTCELTFNFLNYFQILCESFS